MPTTRSMRALSSLASRAVTPPTGTTPKTKRKAQDGTDPSESSSQDNKRAKVLLPSSSVVPSTADAGETDILPATLTFSFATAKQHLITVDSRFSGVFNKLPCRPFEQLERVDSFRIGGCPNFRTLATSILGQQISWLAARSIRHKFVRLYHPSLSEKPPADHTDEAKAIKDIFPTAVQVSDTDISTLKTAGLSTRKAEYIKDLATRFADGRLTNKKLMEADDEELSKLLIEVRGIGRWTVDMFAMFSLRRPDILPVGDLGVQRGLIRWFLSLHSPADSITISDKKLPKTPGGNQDDTKDAVNNVQDGNTFSTSHPASILEATTEDVSSIPPIPITPVKGKVKGITSSSTSPEKTEQDIGGMPMIPEPFTPSINKILNPSMANMDASEIGRSQEDEKSPAPLPEELTVPILRNRLNGKKKIKGALLTPKEMEALTDPWRPYRSLGVYYMWALAEEKGT